MFNCYNILFIESTQYARICSCEFWHLLWEWSFSDLIRRTLGSQEIKRKPSLLYKQVSVFKIRLLKEYVIGFLKTNLNIRLLSGKFIHSYLLWLFKYFNLFCIYWFLSWFLNNVKKTSTCTQEHLHPIHPWHQGGLLLFYPIFYPLLLVFSPISISFQINPYNFQFLDSQLLLLSQSFFPSKVSILLFPWSPSFSDYFSRVLWEKHALWLHPLLPHSRFVGYVIVHW